MLMMRKSRQMKKILLKKSSHTKRKNYSSYERTAKEFFKKNIYY